jgi:GT2 family glycosyltransferase
MSAPQGAGAAAEPEVAIVIPTRDRREVLLETLRRLRESAARAPVEVIVVDDGSADSAADAVAGLGPAPWRTEVLRQDGRGPAAARNRGVAAATAPACLFLGDDSLPGTELVDRHVAFHRSHPEPTEALLGLVVPAPPLDASPLQRWLHEQGAQFGYASLRPDEPAPASSFWTSNVSVKRSLLADSGGFDEGFAGAACEDAELGFRLARAGMTLRYDPRAVAMHFHPTDLARVLRRMQAIGVAYRRLRELAPEAIEPSRPSAKHRIKAAALTLAMLPGSRRPAREASWRFLCDEALREAFWEGAATNGPHPRIGRRLARIALADPEATPPEPSAPTPA